MYARLWRTNVGMSELFMSCVIMREKKMGVCVCVRRCVQRGRRETLQKKVETRRNVHGGKH